MSVKVERFSLGVSWMFKEITALRIGDGDRPFLIAAGFEGGSDVPRLLENTLLSLSREREAFFEKTSFFIVPTVNPDGDSLVRDGLSLSNPFYLSLSRARGTAKDFSSWRANARGVELNKNFRNGWGRVKEALQLSGTDLPCSEGYCGEYPESEQESGALASFVRRTPPLSVFCFCGNGGKVRFNSFGEAGKKNSEVARLLAEGTDLTVTDGYSAGSFCDFCTELNISSFEIGLYKNTERTFERIADNILSASILF